MHQHLRRLSQVWLEDPLYFVTTCTWKRRPVLATPNVAEVLIGEWRDARDRHGWAVGRFVIMPDHVHFFCSGGRETSLSEFMRSWKQWTSKRTSKLLNLRAPLWQDEFFDHVLRSSESYGAKWDYVRENPVRAGLIVRPDDWPWQGEIEKLGF